MSAAQLEDISFLIALSRRAMMDPPGWSSM